MPKSNMSIGHSALDAALGKVQRNIRKHIVENYVDLKHRARVGDAKGAASSTTAFCESVLRELQSELTGQFTPFGTQIKNFQSECVKFENVTPTTSNESQRLIIPRALAFLITLRNKRGTGHVGGDVDANTIDLATTARIADWIVCELLRLHHQLSLEDAQSMLDRLATREVPDVWQFGETKRVLRPDLNKSDQTMLLLYGEVNAVPVETLLEWVEASNLSNFKVQVIKKLHHARLIEYDPETQMVILTPRGEKEVESKLLGN
jgi:hypothetical protein